MILKLGWLFIALFVGYVLIIFNAPNISTSIEKALKIDGFTQKVLNFKDTFDEVVTKVPSKQELKGAYDAAKNGIDKTKQEIDNIREKANDYKDKYEDTVNFINKTKDKLEKAKDTIDNVTNLVSSGAKIIEDLNTSSGIINY